MTNAPKKPQDHKRPQEVIESEKVERFSDVEGSDLMKPFSRVKGSDQVRLLSRLSRLGLISEDGDGDGESVDIDRLDLDELADMIDFVSERFALDQEAFEAFTMGAGGYQRAMTLTVAYAGELGNDDA